MIGPAIYELLNVASVTDLVNGVYNSLAPENVTFPYVVFNEQSTPENYKDDYAVVHHDVQIDVYCSKGKDGNGGFSEADTIATNIKTILHRYKGTVSGKVIAQTLFDNEDVVFDPISQAARVILTFRFREDVDNRSGVGYFIIENTFVVA